MHTVAPSQSCRMPSCDSQTLLVLKQQRRKLTACSTAPAIASFSAFSLTVVYRQCGERLDIWVVRYAGHVPLKYHGLNNTIKCGVEEAVEKMRSIWFVDGAYGDR